MQWKLFGNENRYIIPTISCHDYNLSRTCSFMCQHKFHATDEVFISALNVFLDPQVHLTHFSEYENFMDHFRVVWYDEKAGT